MIYMFTFRMINSKYFKKPTALGKWEEKGYFFSECIWKYYNKLPYMVTRDTKIQSLQYISTIPSNPMKIQKLKPLKIP